MYEIFVQLLQKFGVSSYEVAKKAGVTQTALSNWKAGRSVPKAETMKKIADYFGVTVDYLMTGNGIDIEQSVMTDQEKIIYEYAKRLLALGMTPEKLEKLVDAVENIQK